MSKKKKKKSSPKKIDLHGVKHEDVRSVCIEFIEDNWDLDDEVQFITGYSGEMKAIVIDLLEEYELNFQIGDGFNSGFIISWL